MPLIKDDLAEALQKAEERLEERSGVGSASSEGRDDAQVGQKLQEELEKRSNCSSNRSPTSNASEGTLDSVRIHGQGRVGDRPIQEDLQSHFFASQQAAQVSSLKLEQLRNARARAADAKSRDSHSSHSSRKGSGVKGSAHSGSGSGVGHSRSLKGSVHSGSGSGVGHSELVASSTTAGVKKDMMSALISGQAISQAIASQRENSVNSLDAGSRGSGSGSGSGSGVFNTMSIAQQQHVTDALNEVEIRHRVEVAALKERHDGDNVIREDELEEMVLKIAKLQKDANANVNLQDLLDFARKAKLDADDKRDDLKDQIAGLHARAAHLDLVHKEKISADKKESDRVLAFQEHAQQQALEARHEEMRKLEQKLATLNDRVKQQQSDRAKDLVAKKEAKAQHDEDLKAMAKNEDLYNKAMREIARRDRAKTSFDLAGDDFKEAHRLEDQLLASRNEGHEVNAELVAARLKLLDMRAANVNELERATAEAKSGALGAVVPKQRKGGKGGPKLTGKGKLTSIEEENDPTETLPPSIDAVSSEGAGAGIGDLADFEEDTLETGNDAAHVAMKQRLALLAAEVAEAGVENRQLQGDIVDMDGVHLSKIARLIEQVKGFRSELKDSYSAMEEMRQENIGDQDAQNKSLAEEKAKKKKLKLDHKDHIDKHFRDLQAQADEHDKIVDHLQQQFHFAFESKRVETERIQAIKLEIEVIQKRHSRALEDLRAETLAVPSIEGRSGEGPQQLLSTLRESEQECNLLKNDFDSLRIRLHDELEQEHLQHALTNEKLQNALEQLSFEQKASALLQTKLKEKDNEKWQSLQAMQLNDARSGNDPGAQPLQGTSPNALKSSWWCPPRQVQKESRPETSRQLALWQMVSALRKVVALQVSSLDLDIKNASRRAFELWGSSFLRSPTASLARLLADPRSQVWLRGEIAARTAGCDEFWLRQIGCLEFCSKNGKPFDSVVIVAHLPAEHGHFKDPCYILIIEPMKSTINIKSEKRSGKVASSVGSSSSGQPSPPYAVAGNSPDYDMNSIASGDIGPNDSISNVF